MKINLNKPFDGRHCRIKQRSNSFVIVYHISIPDTHKQNIGWQSRQKCDRQSWFELFKQNKKN